MRTKYKRRQYRHQRIRKHITGIASRPRVCVFRSLNHFHAQMVDDLSGKILLGMSTVQKEMRRQVKNGGNVKAAEALGEAFAKKAKAKGITSVSFDRGGYLYHGRVKAFADAVRKGGLEF